MSQPQLARCPYCQQPTLVTGIFCAYCGRQLVAQPPRYAAPPPAAYPARGPPPAAAPGSRPPIVCSYCGVANDPWLTHCKSCQRPLASTSQ